MTKRLICLLLSLVMLLSCLAGCADKGDDPLDEIADDASEKTLTLSMYLMSEKEVSAEQASAIQEAVNKITKSKFKTQIILRYFTEDEYYTALETAFEKSASADEFEDNFSNALKDETGAATEEETFVNEYGVVELKYPTISDYQVDIFYLSGYDRLMDYIEDEFVADLSTEVTSASKTLNSYIAPGYFTNSKIVCDGIYGIPTNQPIGEYTYMLVKKDILKKYDHTGADFTSIFASNTQHLLDIVSKYHPEYVPLRSFTDNGELDVSNIRFFGVDENGMIDTDSFSLLGGAYKSSWKYLVEGEYTPCANIFNSADFTSQLNTLVTYKQNGYYGNASDADKPFAIGYIKGGAEVIETYGEDYEIVVLEKPTMNTYDMFNNMFSVSANSSDLARSMEIITYLNTNVDFRNLILYGIEGENYKLIESEIEDSHGEPYKVVRRLNDSYMMAPEKTGNVILAYPLEGQAADINEFYKQQNLDSTTNLVLGFTHDFEGEQLSEEHAQYLREKSKEVLAELSAITSTEELAQYINDIRKEISADSMLSLAMRETSITSKEDPDVSLLMVAKMYFNWLEANDMTLEEDDLIA